MVLEDAGELFISKSGKAVMIKLDNSRVTHMPVYLLAFRDAVKALVEDKQASVVLKLLVRDVPAEG